MIKVKINIFVDKNKVLAKARKRFQNDLSFDFLKDKTSSLRFIKTDKLFNQSKQRALVLEKINNFKKEFINY